ncbi:GNAT family N-acetyltransferase [Acerihabitans sp. KWT182]|uniref:GNAT family N-acetyltransferase n=1 Tax=Acerihabitans sp. KWT182 TaxID=3157919 RepID=A0AAU7QD28_9GAMM
MLTTHVATPQHCNPSTSSTPRCPRAAGWGIIRSVCHFGDPRTHRSNPAGPLTTINDAKLCLDNWHSSWERHFFGPWAIVSKSDLTHIIGFGGLSHRNLGADRRINLGYRFAYESWGKGLATQFCRLAIDFGFDVLKFDEIFASVRKNHAAPRHVLDKAGIQPNAELADSPQDAGY